MEISNKIKISSNFIFAKLLLSFVAIYCGKLIYNESISTSEVDFKTSLEIKLMAFVCISFLIYFFLQPIIYYDVTNLYIKRIYTKQTIIPLKNIRSLFNNPIKYKGRTTFSIEYINSEKETSTIKFNINYYSKKISSFITEVKKINNRVEIV
jgi:hypothetical protein